MSTLNVANISDGTDTVETGYVVNGSAKAWVNFNGTGTIAARDSLNVSSLTDNGTGNCSVNFTSAFNAADYAASGGANRNYTTNFNRVVSFVDVPTASSSRLQVAVSSTNSQEDVTGVYVLHFGDLA